MKRFNTSLKRPRGVAAVEFALTAAVFFTALFGAMEMARLLYLWNTTTEATRLGARIAVVCDPNSTSEAIIQAKVRSFLPMLSNPEIEVNYLPAACATDADGKNICSASTATVRVAATSEIQTFIPFVPLALRLPSSATTLTYESMASSIGGGNNPMCQ